MSNITVVKQSSAPLTPTTDKVKIYVGTDGNLRSIDDLGNIIIYSPGTTQEQVEDYVAGLLVAGSGISLSYNDPSNTLTISSSITQYTDEAAQDAVGGALVDSSSVDFTYNDAGNTITAAVLPAGVDHNSLSNFVANKHIDHSAVSISAGTGLSGGGDITTTRTLSLANTAVTSGSYGSASAIPIFTVDAQGRLTAASSTALNPSTIGAQPADGDLTGLSALTGTGVVVRTAADTYTTRTISAGTGVTISNGDGVSGNPSISLSSVGTASTYGSASQVPVITTNAQGQVSSVTNTAISITSTGVSDFTEAAQDAVGGALVDSASIDFTYNDAGNSITAAVLPGGVDHNSLLNFVANKHIDHSTVSITAGTGLSGGGDITASRTLSLVNTAVTAGSYGSASSVPNYTVDAQGRLTAAASTSIQITESQVTNLTTDLSSKVPTTRQVIAGTGLSGGGALSADVTLSMPNVGTAGTYGTTTTFPIITVDAQGRVSSVSTSDVDVSWVDSGGLLTWSDETGKDLVIRQAGAAGSAYIRQVSSNGTLASPTASTSGQRLGGNGFYGWNSTGVDVLPSASMNVYATENHTSTAQGGRLDIELIPNGSTTPVTTASFLPNGDTTLLGAIQIGDTTDTTDGHIRYNAATDEFQGRQAGVWVLFSQAPTYINATAASTTTSATFATITSMTTTPAAGTYKLEFTCSAALSASNSTGDISVFIAGVEQAQCRRTIGNGANTAKAGSVAITTLVTVNGAQTVTIRFRENAAATLTINARELLLTPISR